jgi:hypothetical protein
VKMSSSFMTALMVNGTPSVVLRHDDAVGGRPVAARHRHESVREDTVARRPPGFHKLLSLLPFDHAVVEPEELGRIPAAPNGRFVFLRKENECWQSRWPARERAALMPGGGSLDLLPSERRTRKSLRLATLQIWRGAIHGDAGSKWGPLATRGILWRNSQ